MRQWLDEEFGLGLAVTFRALEDNAKSPSLASVEPCELALTVDDA